MGGAGGGAGALIPEGPGASEEAPGGVPVNREGRNVKYNCGVLQGTEHRYTHTHTHTHTCTHAQAHSHACTVTIRCDSHSNRQGCDSHTISLV